MNRVVVLLYQYDATYVVVYPANPAAPLIYLLGTPSNCLGSAGSLGARGGIMFLPSPRRCTSVLRFITRFIT